LKKDKPTKTYRVAFPPRYISTILPMTEKKLKHWYKEVLSIEDVTKARIAKEAIQKKLVHSFGGAIIVLDMRQPYLEDLLGRIVAFSLMLDYLDDIIETEELSPQDAYKLNKAMLLPLKGASLSEKHGDTSKLIAYSYLVKLVDAAGYKIQNIINYDFVKNDLQKYMHSFVKSQAISCMPQEERNHTYKTWAARSDDCQDDGLLWNEFAAIQASPLRSYALLRYSYRQEVSQSKAKDLCEAYKWLGGINVLGDHIHDLKEDKRNEEVNQIAEFKSLAKAKKSVISMIEHANLAIEKLDDQDYHLAVLFALIIMYIKPLEKDPAWSDLAKEVCNNNARFAQQEIPHSMRIN